MGPGGIGKTHLVIQAAQGQLQHFAHGVWFVSLAAVDSVDLLPSTIMEALDVPRYGGADPKLQFLNYLRDRELLLILDNFEHLLEGTSLITEVLAEAPLLKVLVTSRERLSLREEWLMPLEGMEFPVEEEAAGASEEDYSALQLFVQRAQRVRRDFPLVSAGPGSVARICQLVEGMPLAIELAATWVRIMDCEEIAREIEANLGFLATTLRDVPQRHRSMRAVFDHSWGMLSPEERSVLQRLSVFRGGVRREAAEAVTGTSLLTLAALVDRSWVRRSPSGRYEIQEMVRHYGAEKLEVEPSEGGAIRSEQIRDRHGRYYAAFVHQREKGLMGWGQKEAFEEILEEMDNVWAAWNWAIERGHVETIGQCVRALGEMAELQGWRHEMNQAFEEAATMLRARLSTLSRQEGVGLEEPSPVFAETSLILAELLPCQAFVCYLLGFHERARMLSAESLDLLRGVGQDLRERRATASAMYMLGWALWLLGDTFGGNQLLREALAIYEEINDSQGRVRTLVGLAATPHHLGRYEEAEAHLRQGIAIADEVGDLRWKAWLLANLGEVLCDKGEYQAASRAAEEALRIRQELSDRVGVAHSTFDMADIAIVLGEYESARQHYQQTIALGDEIGFPQMTIRSLRGLGDVASALGHHAEAKQWFKDSLAAAGGMGAKPSITQLTGLGYATSALGEFDRSRQCFSQALEMAMRIDLILESLDVLTGMAHLLAGQGEQERAMEVLHFALHHPATRQVTRDRAQTLVTELETSLPSETFAAATARGQARELEEVAVEVLSR